MALPTRLKDGRYRVRYTDENGNQRHGGVYPTLKEAQFRQKQLETQAGEIRRGIREGRPLDKTFGDLCDYYLEKLTPQRPSGSATRKHPKLPGSRSTRST